jgi:hypothetical protein
MSAFLEKIADGIDVAPLLAQLDHHPELWNVHPERRMGPHVDVSDVWVRYFDKAVLTGPEGFRGKHPFTFYPAWFLLPELRPLVTKAIRIDRAQSLGGVLITRIPSGGQVGWHHDRGSWHAEHFDRKLYLPLRSNSRCVNRVGRESCVMHAGQLWYFDNQIDHAVENNGDTERITLIICLRRFATEDDLADDLEASLRNEGARHGRQGVASQRNVGFRHAWEDGR